MSANTNKAGIVYPSRTPEARAAAHATKRARLVPGRLAEPMRSGVQCRPGIDLLSEARANGTRSATRGLTALICHADPIPARRGRGELVARGMNVTIMPVGKAISADAAARLLEFASHYFENGGET
jgi:hypothetical protein